MTENKTFAVIYLDTQYFDYYALHFQTPLRFTFTIDTVGHMDILSVDSLIGQLTSFITNYKLPSASILLILSDRILFCKEINLMAPDSSEKEEVKTFLDMVPFDHVLSKVYKLDKKIIVAATNQDFVDVFTRAFRVSSQIDACVPSFLLGKEFNLDQGLSRDQAQALIEKSNNIKMWSMPLEHELTPSSPTIKQANNQSDIPKENLESQAEEQIKPKKSNKTRIITMLGLFILLIGVLMFMFVSETIQNNQNDARAKAIAQQKLKQEQAGNNAVSLTPQTALPSGEPATAFTATAQEQSLSISVQYTTNYATQAASIVTDLSNFGIKNVTSLHISSSSSRQILVLVGDKLSSATRQRILSEIQKVEPDAIMETNTQLSVDVLILLQ